MTDRSIRPARSEAADECSEANPRGCRTRARGSALTDEQVLEQAQARLDRARAAAGKAAIPRSLGRHAGSFVLVGDLIRGLAKGDS